jgi:hypothetical protein
MSTIFTPIIEDSRKVTRTVTETVTGFTNCPPVGTHIRLTLGETVVVGTVHKQTFYDGGPKFPVIYVLPDGSKYDHRHFSINITEDAWVIEILDADLDAELEVLTDSEQVPA